MSDLQFRNLFEFSKNLCWIEQVLAQSGIALDWRFFVENWLFSGNLNGQ
jgi:hypothetical protein